MLSPGPGTPQAGQADSPPFISEEVGQGHLPGPLQGKERASLPSFRSQSCVPAGGRVLQIPLVRAEDAGKYSCKASNEVGEDWLHYQLLVLSEWPAWGPGGSGSAGPMAGGGEGLLAVGAQGRVHSQSCCTDRLIT